MNLRKDTGRHGEDLAVDWLLARGYQILHRNWRYAHCEIDIISKRKDIICFIEVKTRTSLLFGLPEEAVTKDKIRCMMKAGVAYMDMHPGFMRVQYDLLCIVLGYKGEKEFFLIEDLSL